MEESLGGQSVSRCHLLDAVVLRLGLRLGFHFHLGLGFDNHEAVCVKFGVCIVIGVIVKEPRLHVMVGTALNLGEGIHALIHIHAFRRIATPRDELLHLPVGKLTSAFLFLGVVLLLNPHARIIPAQFKNNLVFGRAQFGGCVHEGLRGNQGVGVVVKAVIRFLHIISLSGL